MSTRIDFCAFESRATDFVALKLLALSLERHAPESALHLFTAPLPSALVAWFDARPNVVVHPAPEPKGVEWDIKPELLIWLMDNGIERPCWIDADIILANKLPRSLTDAPEDALVIATAPRMLLGSDCVERALDLGREPRTDLPETLINAGLIRFGPLHRPLLLEWQRILQSDAYMRARELEGINRPLAFQSDEAILGALLGSTDFAHLPLAFVLESIDIAQCLRKTGYRPWARALNAVRGTPAFIHALGPTKPWRETEEVYTWESLSPYRLVAMAYDTDLEPGERDWLHRETPKARLLRRLFFNSPELSGLPLALRQALLHEREEIRAQPLMAASEI